jgi:acetyl esterase/lipase
VVRGLEEMSSRESTRDALALDWLNGDVRELRAAYDQSCSVALSSSSAWIEIASEQGVLRALVHEPRSWRARDSAILYFHGGGWIVGSPLTHADISQPLCELTGLRVISVDYRLAPEHKAPAPVADGVVALRHALASEGEKLRTVFLCGDSAGGAIAMAVERSCGGPLREHIAGVCSLYPGFGMEDSPSIRFYGRRQEGLDRECLRRYWALAHSDGTESPYSLAALAENSPVPLFLLACGRDPLRDDAVSMAGALKKIGRELTLDVVESAKHGFLHDCGKSALATDALERIAGWIDEKRRLSRTLAQPSLSTALSRSLS